MSEVATLGNIFFEPGNTFEDLSRKPRFIIATVLISLLVTALRIWRLLQGRRNRRAALYHRTDRKQSANQSLQRNKKQMQLICK